MVDQSITGAAGKVAEGDRSGRARLVIVLLCVALALSMFLSLRSGASDASAVAVIRDWLTGTMPDDAALGARDRLIVYDIRMPRVLLGVLIGAALAVSGAVMQGLFRNPLADPGLIGVSAGSSLGAVAVIVLGTTWL
ncbi:hypothetical protein X773_33585, partial [Mesorhizobium sp. LSJC285A00]|uniref:iron chelate uptake ABC transporter family permease subunit n=2 Tax=unclassified Mesorhizobium TaxID=325217 RepID=UPI0003CE7A0B